jgi:hypothetical protein
MGSLEPKNFTVFEPEFRAECTKIKKINVSGDTFFQQMGYWGCKDAATLVGPELTDLLDVFYIPNLATLDYILKNKPLFQYKVFLDYGCGLGFLSIFLHHIGIKCLCFDGFRSEGRTSNNIERKHTVGCLEAFGLQDYLVELSDPIAFDVFVSMGAKVIDPDLPMILRHDYLIFDDQRILDEHLRDFMLLDNYIIGPFLTRIHKRKS